MTIIYLIVGWFVGIWLGETSSISAGHLPWLVGGAILVVGSFIGQRWANTTGLAVLGMVALGCGRVLIAQPVIDLHHISYYNNGGELTFTGIVTSEPDIRDRVVNLRLETETLQLPGGTTLTMSGLVLVQAPLFPSIQYGDRIEVRGQLEVPPETAEFSYKEYLARQGIHSLTRYPRLIVLAEGQGTAFRHAILNLKAQAQTTILRVVREPEASLLTGILLGNDNGLSPSLQDDFRTTGMTHIIAISGFNVVLIMGVLLKVLEPAAGKRAAAFLSVSGIIIYAILVGGDASVVRATIMAGLFLFSGRILGRQIFPPASLFVAGFLMTLQDPLTLWDVGFQLSFMATLGLMLYAERLSQRVTDWLSCRLSLKTIKWVMPLLSDAVLVTLAAQVLTLPLMMAYFGQLSLISLVANVLILPVQPAVMVWGGLATLTGLLVPGVGQILGWVAWLCLWYTISLVRLLANVPLATIPISLSTTGVVLIYIAILGATWWLSQEHDKRERLWQNARRNLNQKVAVIGSLIVGFLGFAWGNTQADGYLHIWFFDVGQGDAIFIQTPSGRQILVDGGLYPSLLQEQLGQQMPFWDKELDMVIATHPDADHVTALPGVWERYEVEQLLTDGSALGESPPFDALLQTAAAHNTLVHHALAGETIVIEDGVRLEILHPDSVLDEENRNENSVSVRLVYDNFTLLLTGDAEATGEAAMLARGRDLYSLVFKAGHHGSNTSSHTDFLAAVRPQIVVVSAGENNRYGHPHQEVLERVSEIGAVLLRTDELGTIEVVSDGEVMWLQSYGK